MMRVNGTSKKLFALAVFLIISVSTTLAVHRSATHRRTLRSEESDAAPTLPQTGPESESATANSSLTQLSTQTNYTAASASSLVSSSVMNGARSDAGKYSARRDPFPEAKQIAEAKFTDASGNMARIRILKTDFEYPLIRVVERTIDGKLSRQYMVADRVLVKRAKGQEARAFVDTIRKAGGKILSSIPQAGIYMVGGIDGRDPHGVDRILAALQSSGNGVAYAQPDYVHFMN